MGIIGILMLFKEHNEHYDDGYRLLCIIHYTDKNILKYVKNIGLDIFSLAPNIARHT